MKRLAAALVIALLPALAHAQAGLDRSKGPSTRYSEEEKRREADNERAYRDAVKNTRGNVTETYDPWRNIRPEAEKKTR